MFYVLEKYKFHIGRMVQQQTYKEHILCITLLFLYEKVQGVPKVREKSYRIYFLIGSRYSNNFFYRIVVLYLKFLFNIIHFITNAQNDYHRLKYINSFFPRY